MPSFLRGFPALFHAKIRTYLPFVVSIAIGDWPPKLRIPNMLSLSGQKEIPRYDSGPVHFEGRNS
jgi:hypothetical protein